MSTLTDHVDRLSQLASSIRASAFAVGRLSDDGEATASAGPFTRAILNTPLGDLIRDSDPSELGLFTLVQPTHHAANQEDAAATAGQKAEIGRVALPIATPLRRPPAMIHPKKDRAQRPGEHEPEVYANAALKYLDR